MKWPSPRRPQSVIALSVSRGQLRFAHAARAKQALAVLPHGAAPLALELGRSEEHTSELQSH